jgi:hypothetical protein
MTNEKILKLANRLARKVAPHLLENGLEIRMWHPAWKLPTSTMIAVTGRTSNDMKTFHRFIAFVESQVASLNTKQTKEIILHELAHALCGYKRGHGKRWQTVCAKIGGVPRKYFSE